MTTPPPFPYEAHEWFCCARSNHGYLCTLDIGHDGAHVALGGGVVVDTWAQTVEATR